MDLAIVDKLLAWLFKLAALVIQYFRSRPEITLSSESLETDHSGEGQPTYQFLWKMKLVVHNDSSHLARGVKINNTLPPEFNIEEDFPTRLDLDKVVKLPVAIRWREDQTSLVTRFGTSSQYNMSNRLLFEILDRTKLQIVFQNESGRRFHLLVQWNKGVIQSRIVKGFE